MLKRELRPVGNIQGKIYYKGICTDDLNEHTSACEIGFVLQDPDSQIITDKVFHELAFGLESLGLENSVIKRKIAETACYFGIENIFYKSISELSGGQKQLLNLASVVAMNPEILILDEPTAQLDPIAREMFLNTLRKLNSDLSMTIIIAEHCLEDVLPMCDRLIFLDKGKLSYNESPENICSRIKDGTYFLEAMPDAVKITSPFLKGDEKSPLTAKAASDFIDKRLTVDPISVEAKEKCKNTILELRDVSFKYDKDSTDTLRNLSLRLFESEILFVLGGNGAGKTTFLNVAAGIYKNRTGQIRLFGKRSSAFKDRTIYRNNIAVLPQDVRTVFVKDSVEDDFRETGANAEEYGFDVSHLLSKHPYDLSGGERQLCALIKVLAGKPKILLLDEPTKGADPLLKRRIADILLKLKAKEISMIVVSHDTDFAAMCADRCALLFGGEIVSQGEPHEFFSQNRCYTTATNKIMRQFDSNIITPEEAISSLDRRKP